MISVSWEPQGLIVRVTGSDRLLAWPEPGELVLPTDVVSGAACHPALATLPDQTRLFWSAGHGLRTIPVVPGQWIFGRRRINTERFYFAVRGRNIPVLVVSARNWQLDGVVVSTPEAAEIAASLSTFGDSDTDDRCRTS